MFSCANQIKHKYLLNPPNSTGTISVATKPQPLGFPGDKKNYYTFKSILFTKFEVHKWGYHGTTTKHHLFFRYDKLNPLGIAINLSECTVQEAKEINIELATHRGDYRKVTLDKGKCIVLAD